MAVPRANQIHIGTPVSIILKQDQPTGRQVQGTVAEILTRGDHPRGIKVRLTDGRIGRVQGLSFQGQGQLPQQEYASQGGSNTYGGHASGYQTAPSLPHRPSQPYGQHQQALYPQYSMPQQTYEAQPNRIAAARQGAGEQEDTAAQVEHFQVYEQAKGPSQQDIDQRSLEQEFPHVDGSLIAALYGDLQGDMSGCREMLQAIGSEQ
jgi:uncharacterized repeat protein (TIGR03833 family)